MQLSLLKPRWFILECFGMVAAYWRGPTLITLPFAAKSA